MLRARRQSLINLMIRGIRLDDVLGKLQWLGHDCFLYNGPPVIYFNPSELYFVWPADLTLIGHEHFHHPSWPDIKKIWRPGTAIITDASAACHINEPVTALAPGEPLTIGETVIGGGAGL